MEATRSAAQRRRAEEDAEEDRIEEEARQQRLAEEEAARQAEEARLKVLLSATLNAVALPHIWPCLMGGYLCSADITMQLSNIGFRI